MSTRSIDRLLPELTFDKLVTFCQAQDPLIVPDQCDSLIAYIRYILDLPADIDQLPNTLSSVQEMESFNGLYLLYQETLTEGYHYFGLHFFDHTIMLIQTYGELTTDQIIIKTYDRSDWLRSYERALTGERKAFAYVFDLPPEMLCSRCVPRLIGNIQYLKIEET